MDLAGAGYLVVGLVELVGWFFGLEVLFDGFAGFGFVLV